MHSAMIDAFITIVAGYGTRSYAPRHGGEHEDDRLIE